MAIWKSYRISDAVAEIDEEKFVLPVIQRRLVWEEEKMIQLFDTLLKGDSFGGIMVIEEEKGEEPLFSFRPFTRDGEPIDSRNVTLLTQQQFFVIDGQQRLQTFYIGLKGSINGKVLYFDLFSNYNDQFEFRFENDVKKLPKATRENEGRMLPACCWSLASTLLKRLKETNDEDQVASEIIKKLAITDENERLHITKNVKAFYKNIITAETVGIAKVAVNKSFDEVANKQRIVELFRRLNDGGTKLSPFELVASVLKGFSWEMEGFLEKTLKEFEDIGLTQDNLIKLIFLLIGNYNREMSEITASDAKFAIDNRQRIVATLAAVRQFLKAADLYNFYKEGNRSFIPLFFVAYHVYYTEKTDAQLPKAFDNYDAKNDDFARIKKWIYLSLFSGVFRSRGAGWTPYRTGIRKIFEVVSLFKGAPFPAKELFNVYYEYGVTFTEEPDKKPLDELESQFLYYLMYDRKSAIRIQDIDHIMPKSLLEGKEDWSAINSIANYQLIDSGTNRGEKNAKPFRYWIDNCVTDKSAFVIRHLIPPDQTLWDESQFKAFICARAELIVEKIRRYVL